MTGSSLLVRCRSRRPLRGPNERSNRSEKSGKNLKTTGARVKGFLLREHLSLVAWSSEVPVRRGQDPSNRNSLLEKGLPAFGRMRANLRCQDRPGAVAGGSGTYSGDDLAGVHGDRPQPLQGDHPGTLGSLECDAGRFHASQDPSATEGPCAGQALAPRSCASHDRSLKLRSCCDQVSNPPG